MNYQVYLQPSISGRDIMDDKLLERRRTCLLSISHDLHRIDREVYEFCETFSNSSEDLADATANFLLTLQGIHLDSNQNGRGVDSEGSAAIS